MILDRQGISTFTDFFVICSGTSEPHLKAIAGEIEGRWNRQEDAAQIFSSQRGVCIRWLSRLSQDAAL